MKIHIVFSPMVDLNDASKMVIGGIQTYLRNLVDVINEMKCIPIIYQYAKEDFTIDKDDYCVVGIVSKDNPSDLIRCAENNADLEKDILIFGSSSNCRKSRFKKVISIQHGIYWDVPSVHGLTKIPSALSTILRCVQTLIEIRKQRYATAIVCVDYNYINWYRSQTIDRNLQYNVIPNFVDHNRKLEAKRSNNKIRIIFARRFETYRGTEVIVKPFKNILKRYSNIEITFAGNGSRADRLHQLFDEYKNVDFIEFDASESLDVHSDYDIAVVPSIGSEGTSLSLLEAMGAGCAVVASDVGGMSNIILDDYNGKIVRPIEQDIEDALVDLIEDPKKREKMSRKACETVVASFSLEQWKKRWKTVIESLH